MWADQGHSTQYTVQVLGFQHICAFGSYKCVIFAPPPTSGVRVRACIELEIYI